jgi:hypothetical protein
MTSAPLLTGPLSPDTFDTQGAFAAAATTRSEENILNQPASMMDPHSHAQRMSLVTRAPKSISCPSSTISTSEQQQQQQHTAQSPSSHDVVSGSLEEDELIFGLADLSFGERSTGSGGAVGQHRPPHW